MTNCFKLWAFVGYGEVCMNFSAFLLLIWKIVTSSFSYFWQGKYFMKQHTETYTFFSPVVLLFSFKLSFCYQVIGSLLSLVDYPLYLCLMALFCKFNYTFYKTIIHRKQRRNNGEVRILLEFKNIQAPSSVTLV